jgi:hypothetical protein
MEFPDNRYDGLHIANLLSVEDEKSLSDSINCDMFNSLFVSKRIGSESQVGTIWLSSLNNISFIIKVQSNRNKAHAEYEVQHSLSHKWAQNFLIAYSNIDCPQYKIGNFSCKRNFQSDSHVTLWEDGEPNVITTGNFIFMETAVGDLAQVIRYSIVDERILTGYILDVIDSVEIMSMEKVFHGDLHIRQIFIVLRNGNNCESVTKAVIGDFGEHLLIDSPTMHLSDLKIFFKSLLEIVNQVQNFEKLKIENCLGFITKRITQIESDDDLLYNIESIQQDISEIKNFFRT